MEYILQTHDLTKTYGKKDACKDINISIREGEIYGLIGRNGAGKTTIMRMISGLSNPTSGSYALFGKEGVKELAEQMKLPLLAQIPVVQDICESGDNGIPAATNPASITGQAFLQLAAKIVTETDKRRATLPPTQIVGLKKQAD